MKSSYDEVINNYPKYYTTHFLLCSIDFGIEKGKNSICFVMSLHN